MSLISALDHGSDEPLTELSEIQRGRARDFVAEAVVLAGMAATTTGADWMSERPYGSLVLEVAGTCQIGQQAAAQRLDDATHLIDNLPVLTKELQAGRVLVPQARVLIDETRSLSPEISAEVDARI